MLITNQPQTLYTREKAEALASQLNEDKDDEFRYIAKHDPKGTGFSYIVCLDPNNEIIGTF